MRLIRLTRRDERYGEQIDNYIWINPDYIVTAIRYIDNNFIGYTSIFTVLETFSVFVLESPETINEIIELTDSGRD